MRRTVELGNEVALAFAADDDAVLRGLEERVGCRLSMRGDVVTLDGEAEAVAGAMTLVGELAKLVEAGHPLDEGTLGTVTGALAAHAKPGEVLDDVVWRHRSTRVAPKTVNQKRYVDAIRRSTVTFGIGPAGTGKTFLAVAMAAQALASGEVRRIILTRPAVEAGERLGFLPGDLMAKIDPYLRPLFDALGDMLEPEKVAMHLERGVIEVAPLAFMRGRAQPVDEPVLTPEGWRPIADLRVGDLVVGRDGRPTPVLGVHPQGRRPVFDVRCQDGASTRACAEHLWFVTTPDDRERGEPGHVVRTQDMAGRLRGAHQHRFELPLVDAVAFPGREVPIEPYALGLLLGEGCPTTRTGPSSTTPDPELAEALEAALPGVELRRRTGVDHVLRHPAGGRGGVITADPVTEALRELGLAGTRSTTTFVPAAYLHNSAEVRLAVLQGLLDSDGGPVTQQGRPCRVQYTTCSDRLRDDVVFLVRSLGGVASARTRPAAGRAPGGTADRPVHHRHDTHVLDIRLPEGVDPFRLTRKRERYAQHGGGGRPARFVEAIEPAGEAECVCISVGAADSLYVTRDLLVTHNTLNDSFVILDEAQNTTPEQMKMFLTRLGFGSKMVVTGDVTQIDLPRHEQSGLIVVAEILEEVEGVDFVRFGGEDVVRHRLVQRIVEAYDKHNAAQAPELRPARRA